MRTLAALLNDVRIVSCHGNLNLEISGINHDSRRIEEKNCFVAVKGFKKDGLDYLEEAINRGANSIVSESNINKKFKNVTWIQVEDGRLALSKMVSHFYDNPSENMYVIGVTGTNGKTTIVSLIEAIVNRESKIAKIGTLGMNFGRIFRRTSLTTPEATDIFNFLSEAKNLNCNNLVIEVSSVGLKLHRVEDIHFSQAVFSTFSGDHLDFHKSMIDYFLSKIMLFKKLSAQDWAVINIDEPTSKKIINELDSKFLTYGFSEHADVRPLKYKFSANEIQALVYTPKGKIEIKSSLIGRINLTNILAAITSAVIKGISLDNISSSINDFKAVKGRLDFVYRNDFSVLIDYAHTDKALEGLLQSLREIALNRVILVFGAGGARDKTKRPRMGDVASRNADFVVVTSDNPRNEDPKKIIDDIVDGFNSNFTNFFVEVERKNAIRRALDIADKGDIVVIAGKGHEDYQIFKDKTIDFDDYEVVRRILKEKSA